MFIPAKHVKPRVYLDYLCELNQFGLLPPTYSDLLAKTQVRFNLKYFGAMFTISSALDAVSSDARIQERYAATGVFLKSYLTERIEESISSCDFSFVKNFLKEDSSDD